LFPVLFEIPNAWSMSGGALVLEIVVGLACFLAWLALHLRGRRDWIAANLNTVAVLIGLHLVLSKVMGDKPITIYSFGVIIILGFLAGAWYMIRQTDKLKLDSKKIFDWAFWMLVVGIIGARVLYALLNYEEFSGDKLKVLQIWNGGLVWYGGLIPAAVVGVALLWKHKLPTLHVADVGAAVVILALGIGRWACLLAGDDYGRVTDGWWGIRFYNDRALVPPALRGQLLWPTQMMMSINCLWMFFILEWIRRRAKFAGQAFAWMLILYAVTRAVLIEPFRGDFVERNPGYKKHLAAQIVIDKDEDSPAVHLERGAEVSDNAGRTGKLLEDLDLPAGQAFGSVYAITDEPAKEGQRNPMQRATGQAQRPDWNVDHIEGLPGSIAPRPGGTDWYGSHLPKPPGYVSTSQWISVFVVAAGVLLLVFCRRLNQPGFTEAVETAQAEADSNSD
jgi:phosphatidylglycerol:prolipoprotein diacylglycerol transferase